MDDDAEERVKAFSRATLYLLHSAKISGGVMVISAIVGLARGHMPLFAAVALALGIAFSLFGWGTMVRVRVGDVHWSTADARARRRFRRSMRKELG